ncbi:MAG: hypothetical protein M3373_08880 [Gemmatimonadota bacterium]|nr:hypothetical protein [Gemmatimonadota bacterium]
MGVRTDRGSLLDAVAARLPPCWTVPPSPAVDRLYSIVAGGPAPRGVRRFFLLYQGGALLLRTLNADECLDALDTDIRLYVAERARSYLCIHAGVVGWKGNAIVIAGRSRSGKTTLVRALLDAGATYYSDDCAFIDDRGFVHPFATPLSIRDESSAQQRKVRPDELGATTGTEPLQLGLVTLASYRKGAVWRSRKLSPGRAAIALIRNSASVRVHPRLALDRLQRIVVNVRVLTGVYGDTADICREILT